MKGHLIDRTTGWLDAKLMPVFGPPPLGPYGPQEEVDPAVGLRPVCLRSLADHEVDADTHTHHIYLRCPGGGELETARH